MNDEEIVKKCFREIEPQSREFFLKDYHHTRKVMCSASSTLEDIKIAFDGLTQSYLRCNILDSDREMFVALLDEQRMRSQAKLDYLMRKFNKKKED